MTFLRIVRNLCTFVSRLLQSFIIAFTLLAAFYILCPQIKITAWPFIVSLLIVVGLLLSIRAICYGIMKRPLLTERMLVLGTSPLAGKIAQETESALHLRYTIVGIADNAIPSCGTILRYPFLLGWAMNLKAPASWKRALKAGLQPAEL
jgi:FlaA1/EpsC-like NDP-sugar epimerase